MEDRGARLVWVRRRRGRRSGALADGGSPSNARARRRGFDGTPVLPDRPLLSPTLRLRASVGLRPAGVPRCRPLFRRASIVGAPLMARRLRPHVRTTIPAPEHAPPPATPHNTHAQPRHATHHATPRNATPHPQRAPRSARAQPVRPHARARRCVHKRGADDVRPAGERPTAWDAGWAETDARAQAHSRPHRPTCPQGQQAPSQPGRRARASGGTGRRRDPERRPLPRRTHTASPRDLPPKPSSLLEASSKHHRLNPNEPAAPHGSASKRDQAAPAAPTPASASRPRARAASQN